MTFKSPDNLKSLSATLASRNRISTRNGALIVRTDVLMPDLSPCEVLFHADAKSGKYYATDACAAFSHPPIPDAPISEEALTAAKTVASRYGMHISNNCLKSPLFTLEGSAGVTRRMANAMRDVSLTLLSLHSPQEENEAPDTEHPDTIGLLSDIENSFAKQEDVDPAILRMSVIGWKTLDPQTKSVTCTGLAWDETTALNQAAEFGNPEDIVEIHKMTIADSFSFHA